MLEISDIVFLLYSVFTEGITEKEHYLEEGEKEKRAVGRFIERFEKRGIRRGSLGISFLYDYFCDSYNYWTNSGRELRKIPLIWIIGEPQLARWDRRYEHYVYSYTEGFLHHSNTRSLRDIRLSLLSKEKGSYEEKEKERSFNTLEGRINCFLVTSLYNRRSKWCRACSSKQRCKSRLIETDKKLALLRGCIKL